MAGAQGNCPVLDRRDNPCVAESGVTEGKMKISMHGSTVGKSVYCVFSMTVLADPVTDKHDSGGE